MSHISRKFMNDSFSFFSSNSRWWYRTCHPGLPQHHPVRGARSAPPAPLWHGMILLPPRPGLLSLRLPRRAPTSLWVPPRCRTPSPTSPATLPPVPSPSSSLVSMSVFRLQKYLICSSVCEACFTIAFRITELFQTLIRGSVQTTQVQTCFPETDTWQCLPVRIAWALSGS